MGTKKRYLSEKATTTTTTAHMIVFVLDSVKDTDFYKKNRIVTTDSRFVELATKFQALDYLALLYFSSLLLFIIAIHLFFVFVRWFRKQVDVFRKTRYDIVNYRIVRVTVNDDMKGEVKKSPLKTFQGLFQPSPIKNKRTPDKKALKVPELELAEKNGTTTKTPITPPKTNGTSTQRKKEEKKSPS